MITIKSIVDVDPTLLHSFSCGNDNLDTYLKQFASQNHKKNIGKSFVALHEGRVIGYYTLSMAHIEFSDIPEGHNRGIPKYPVPVVRIGRLAVDTQLQGKKIGSALLIDALIKILEATKTVAAFAVVVDAKNENAKKFYSSFGFIEYKDDMSLFLPMKTIKKFLS